MASDRILVTVKTYPELSKTYGETVCTAGIREDGTWVRLYPVPFRRLGGSEQYKLYDWITCPLVRHSRDPRPESYRPTGEIECVDHVGTADNWRERRELLLGHRQVHASLSELIEAAKNNRSSLATFKPAKLIEFEWEEGDREWDASKLEAVRNIASQPDLFDDASWSRTFQVVDKVPYNFHYRVEDADGRESRMRILEWQLGALYRNCLRSADGDEAGALAKVRQKYFDEFVRTDLHLFLGTTLAWHKRAPNPWTIVGVLPIPYRTQQDLFVREVESAPCAGDAAPSGSVRCPQAKSSSM